VAACLVGFGAVLLTRGGRRREYYPNEDLDAAWEAAMEGDDPDDAAEPSGPEEAPHA